jgi:putative glutamine amidotransferase
MIKGAEEKSPLSCLFSMTEGRDGGMQPVIGLTCSQEADTYYVYRHYGEAVLAAGGLPVLLPAVSGCRQAIGDYAELINGLLLTGGGDISPHYYGEAPLEALGKITPERDWFELELCKEMMSRFKPRVGYLPGSTGAERGGRGQSLSGLPSQKDQVLQHRQSAPRWFPSHQVVLERGSRLAAMMEGDLLPVNSFHHQGVKAVGSGLKSGSPGN